MRNRKQTGQGLVEYALVLVLILVVIIVMVSVLFGGGHFDPCGAAYPTAGQVVDCIATRTAIAHTR